MLRVATAVELVKCEPGHEKMNVSFAIGQLVLASASLQKIDRELALQCRSFYNAIENDDFNLSMLEAFRNSLWRQLLKV